MIDDSIINAINADITAGTVTLDVQFKESFRSRWVDHMLLVVDCKKVDLFFAYSDKSRAQMLNPSHKCRVEQHRSYY